MSSRTLLGSKQGSASDPWRKLRHSAKLPSSLSGERDANRLRGAAGNGSDDYRESTRPTASNPLQIFTSSFAAPDHLIDIIDTPPSFRFPLANSPSGRWKMEPYRIVLLSPGEAVHEERMIECAHDDDAIDFAGQLDHPHAIDIWQHDRHVARFSPWSPPPPFCLRK